MNTILKALTSSRVIGAVFLIPMCLSGSGAAFGQEAVSLPEGQGSELVSEKCAACHALSTALVKRASRDVWEDTVDRMVMIYRAPIDDPDRAMIIDYLTMNFGEGSSYNPGQQMLAEQCFRCHGEGMWKDLKTDRDGWLSALYRMVGRGGRWTADQINVMADYLAETYPEGAGQ